MFNNKYLIVKKKNDKSITYFEYDKIEGYEFVPKKNIKIEDAINVNKIVIINPSLINKITKKKIDLKFRKIVKLLSTVYETDDDTDEGLNEVLNEVNRLKSELKNKYIKYITQEEYDLNIKKLNIILDEVKLRLYYLQMNLERIKYERMEYVEDLSKEGKTR